MKNIKKKIIVLICIAVAVIGVGLYFLLSPGYFRNLNALTPVEPSWTQESVILYEKEFFGHTNYEVEESEGFTILKFEPISRSYGTVYYGHEYFFKTSSGKLHHFSYVTNSEGGGCEHARNYYNRILVNYGYGEDSSYCHLEAYNGMLGGKRYHISVFMSDGLKNYSQESPIDITFWPGW